MRLDPSHTSPERWRSVVARSLRILHLSSIEGRRVSDLSASERKLLTIGVELAGDPAILFLDEPTVGSSRRREGYVQAALLYSLLPAHNSHIRPGLTRGLRLQSSLPFDPLRLGAVPSSAPFTSPLPRSSSPSPTFSW